MTGCRNHTRIQVCAVHNIHSCNFLQTCFVNSATLCMCMATTFPEDVQPQSRDVRDAQAQPLIRQSRSPPSLHAGTPVARARSISTRRCWRDDCVSSDLCQCNINSKCRFHWQAAVRLPRHGLGGRGHAPRVHRAQVSGCCVQQRVRVSPGNWICPIIYHFIIYPF